MKNFLIFLLLVVVVVLGFLLYKRQTAASQPLKPGRTAGATHQRKDHKGNNVNTQDCEILVGQNNDVCIIPISYLRNMTQPGGQDTAIEVHRKYTLIWYGDGGESLDVQPLPGVDCSKHAPDPPSPSSPNLTGQISSPGVLQVAQVTDAPDHDLYCYKTTVKVTLNGQTTQIDPHIFNYGP
jgi:hypothetical protein